MTTAELEQYLEGLNESPNLDYKSGVAWNPKSMAKDFIAMANVRDGGVIIFGVAESKGVFTITGVEDEIIKTYKIDDMRDQLASYMEPSVDFTLHFPVDREDRKFVVIKIKPFKEVPVISRCNIPGELLRYTIYYRNTNKRVESGPVSNAADLRDIIETAAVRMMQRRRAAGFTVALPESGATDVATSDKPAVKLISPLITESDVSKIPIIKFAPVVAQFPDDGVLEKIRSRGYWEIRFTPATPGHIATLSECLHLVERARTRLNWDFPHIPPNNTAKESLLPAAKCYQASSDLGSRKEFWQFYQSEHFLMFRSLIEDWYEGDVFRNNLAQEYPPGAYLSLYSSLSFLVTETLEFLSRLCQNGLYAHGVKLEMTLHNTKDRQLKIDASGRAPFMYDRKTLAEQIAVDGEWTANELIENSLAIGNDFIMKILDAFGFNPPKENFLKIQKDWLDGTFQ